MIYLDNAATTKIDPEVYEAMQPYLLEQYGNPSAQYALGIDAKNAVEKARETIAGCLNCEPEEIYFTSGGTESDNWILNQPNWDVIITSEIEHHAVLNNVITKHYKSEIGVDKYGRIQLDKFREEIEQFRGMQNICASIMFANNEIGTIQDMSIIAGICKDNNVFLHTDAVQAFGHIPIDVQQIPVNALSSSGHKFNGPKGIGFLYIRKGFDIIPMLRGGKQENHLRSGTENVAGIVGIAKAAEISIRDMKANTLKINEIRNILYGEITNKIPIAHLNGTADWRKRLPGSLNFRFDGVRGEELVEWFNQNEIAVSSGSACATGTGEVSHVLRAIGLTEQQARSSVRFTAGKFNDRREVQKVVDVLEFYVNTVHRN